MKLEIIDRNYELHHAFEETAKSVEAEINANRRKDITRRFSVTMGFIVTICSALTIGAAIFLPPIVKWWALIFSFLCVLAYALIFAFVDIAPKKDIDAAINKAEHEQHGDVFDIIQEIVTRNIKSVEVSSISTEEAVTTLEMCFDCQEGYFDMQTYFLKPVLRITRDKNQAGILSVDLKSNTATCYYKDAVTSTESLEVPEKIVWKGR